MTHYVMPDKLDWRRARVRGGVELERHTVFEGDHGVRSALFRMPAGARLREHTHPGWVQVVVLEGEMAVTESGATPHRVSRGGCYFVQPGETHAEEALVDSLVLVTQAEDRPEFGG